MTRIQAFAAVLLALCPVPIAQALDTLQEVECICADDALNTGDYVSCVAHLSRRLVANGSISRAERSLAVSAASRTDYELLSADCEAPAADTACAPAGWGVSLATDSAFYPESRWPGVPVVASAVLRQWNFTEVDAFQVNQNGGDPDCQYRVVVRDSLRNIVRQDFVTCGPTFAPFDLPAGTCAELALDVPLAALNAETGLLDGEPLGPGIYLIEATWSRQGPQAAPAFVTEGGLPRAAVSVRVVD